MLVLTVFLGFGALAQTGVVDFESLTEGQQVGSQVNGLTFRNAQVVQSQVSLNEAEYPPHSGSKAIVDVGGPITITFAKPVTSFSGYFTHGVALTIKAQAVNGGIVTQTTSAIDNRAGSGKGSPNELLTVANDGGFNSITIQGAAGGTSFVMDDANSILFTPGPTVLSLDHTFLVYDYVTGKPAPPTQTVLITATSDQPFSVSTPTSWLRVVASRASTPATVAVSANPVGMAPGSYTGFVVFTSLKDTLSLQVTLHVVPKPQLFTVPTSMAFQYTVGDAAPAAQPIYVAASNANVDYFIRTQDPWVSSTPDYGTTGLLDFRLSIKVDPTGLKPGHYATSIFIYSVDASNSPLTVPVTLDVGN